MLSCNHFVARLQWTPFLTIFLCVYMCVHVGGCAGVDVCVSSPVICVYVWRSDGGCNPH